MILSGQLRLPLVSGTEELVRCSGCPIPCNYNQFINVDRKEIQFNSTNPAIFFKLRFSTTKITIKEDFERYAFPSFLAEVGGALGLFLGFSFMTCWDLYYFLMIKFYKRFN